jgi:hypothetical protein
MAEAEIPVATRLCALVERAGFSMAAFARAMGYRGASSIQRYLDPETFTLPRLPQAFAEKAAAVLEGRGSPPVRKGEVLALAGMTSNTPHRGRPRRALLDDLDDIDLQSVRAIREIITESAEKTRALERLKELDVMAHELRLAYRESL